MVHITYRLSQAQDRLTKKKKLSSSFRHHQRGIRYSWSPCLHTSPYAQCIIANKGAGNKPRVFFIRHNHSVDWVGSGSGRLGIVGYQTSSCFQVMPTSALLSRERASRHLVFEDDVPGCDVSIVLSPSEDVTGMSEDVQGVDDTGDVTQDGEQDVDEEVGTASALEEDTDGRQDDGEDDLDDVAVDFVVSLCGRETQRCRALPPCCSRSLRAEKEERLTFR